MRLMVLRCESCKERELHAVRDSVPSAAAGTSASAPVPAQREVAEGEVVTESRCLTCGHVRERGERAPHLSQG